MKRNFTLFRGFGSAFILIFLLCFPAEKVSAQRFRGGVVAGINLSQIDGDRLGGFNQIGLNAGGRVAAILSERWQLSMELLFSQQGSNRTLNDDPGATYEKIRLNLVEVPVMINFLEWKFHVSAGLSYGRIINFKAEDVYGEDVSDTQNYRSNLLFAIVSATYYFTDQIGLNLGWSKSLNNIQADSGNGTYLGRNIQIRGIYLF